MTNRKSALKAIVAAAAVGASADARAGGLRVGVIGAGWFGKLNLNALMQVAPVEHVAFADVDSEMLAEAGRLTLARPEASLAGPPALYRDYREMLAANRFDIAVVATPDHWHALPAIAAMEQVARMAEIAVGILAAEIRARKRNAAVETVDRVVSHSLVLRESVAAPY